MLKVFLENIIGDAVVYATHARRRTITGMDVVYALRRQGRTLCKRYPSESPSIMPLHLTRSLRLSADGFGG